MTVQPLALGKERLRILGDDEIAALYARPQFDAEERDAWFSLVAEERAAFATLHSFRSQLCFLLQLGYFKARQQFFLPTLNDARDDVRYLCRRYFANQKPPADLNIDKRTRFKHQTLILTLCGYRRCDATEREQLREQAARDAKILAKPLYLCRELIQTLQRERIVLPGYRWLQDTISQSLSDEHQRLSALVQAQLTPADRDALQQLLDNANGLYDLTQLKREPRDFRHREIQRELLRRDQLQPLYRVGQRVLPILALSNESVAYFASLVDYYSVYKLKRLNRWQVYIYLLCFARHRTQRLHDHLLDTFRYQVRRLQEQIVTQARDALYAAHRDREENFSKAGRVLKLFTDPAIAQTTPFGTVQHRAFSILPPPALNAVADQIDGGDETDLTALEWAQCERLAATFKVRLRPLVLAVELRSHHDDDPLFIALQQLKKQLRQHRSLEAWEPRTLPKGLLTRQQRRYLMASTDDGDTVLQPDRYEFWLYRQLSQALEAGDLFCADSVRFRSLDDDLVNDRQWRRKKRLIANSGLPRLQQPIDEQLTHLEETLEQRYRAVNERIADGENAYFKPHPKTIGRWSLPTPRDEAPVNHGLFDQLAPITLSTVLQYADQSCDCLAAFESLFGRYARPATPANRPALIAALVAWGTNLGLGRMGEICDISSGVLTSTSEALIRLETLSAANDRISNALTALPIWQHYTLDEGLHSSSDGQKFETGQPTFNARHSPKYFGLKKGVVAYTLVANHVPINAQIIGAHEHESHYVFDLLFNNTTDIRPAAHSTDTHGTNQVNFALLHLFGYRFAPRYRNLYATVSRSLLGFRPASAYANDWIKPARRVRRDWIREDWPAVQRLIVSLMQKTTTQSIIVSKLSTHAKQNRLKRALWEYDSIIKSLYLLDYIDQLPLRQQVQRALNRGESYHKLRRAISYANFGRLRFRTEPEQQIWSECSRLLTNAIIFFNASLLSQLLVHRERRGDGDGVAALATVSPVAWQHINLYGSYAFQQRYMPIDMAELVNRLSVA